MDVQIRKTIWSHVYIGYMYITLYSYTVTVLYLNIKIAPIVASKQMIDTPQPI